MQRYNWCVFGSNQNAAPRPPRLAPLCATVLCLHAALFPLMLELRSYVVDRQKEEASPLPFACEPAVRVGRAGLATRRVVHTQSTRPLRSGIFSRNNKATMPGTDKEWSELSEAEKVSLYDTWIARQ